MAKVGILLHCRHLDTIAWENLAWGIPDQDKMGDLPTLVRAILTLQAGDEVDCIIIGTGPSFRNGLSESAYPKQYLVDNFDKLAEFPRLRPLLAKLSPAKMQALRQKIEDIILTKEIINTRDETIVAAGIFAKRGVKKVFQIAAASHASRCVKEQGVARELGHITPEQVWFTVTSEVAFEGSLIQDVVVIEPLHRRDQVMTHHKPWLSQLMKPYFFLNDEQKLEFNKLVANFMAEHTAKPDAVDAEATL